MIGFALVKSLTQLKSFVVTSKVLTNVNLFLQVSQPQRNRNC
jgi:hypothetical protein